MSLRFALAMFPILMATSVVAQQQQILPLSEWRAQLDYELSRIPMTREAHGQVIAILQNAERQAQAAKMRELPPSVPKPPPEGQ
jgi:hypothetical protein